MQPDEQADDRTLRGALFDVDLPAGMQQRLLDRLRAEAADQTSLLAGSTEATVVSRESAATDRLAGDGVFTREVNARDSLDDTQAARPPAVELARAAEPMAGRDQRQAAGRSSRRQWATALALSIVALAALGVYQWTRPTSTEQLAQFTLGQLDRLLADEAVWQTDFDQHLPELALLKGQLRFDIRAIGVQDHSGGALADQCRVWKLYSLATHKVFFVFDFKQANHIQSLTRQLQELKRSSGGWSLAAMQADGRVVVVAVEGRVDSYLYQLQSA